MVAATLRDTVNLAAADADSETVQSRLVVRRTAPFTPAGVYSRSLTSKMGTVQVS
jgi:hypothetical protein